MTVIPCLKGRLGDTHFPEACCSLITLLSVLWFCVSGRSRHKGSQRRPRRVRRDGQYNQPNSRYRFVFLHTWAHCTLDMSHRSLTPLGALMCSSFELLTKCLNVNWLSTIHGIFHAPKDITVRRTKTPNRWTNSLRGAVL